MCLRQELRKDECLLLCSDGLSNEMADQEMLFEVAHGQRRSDCCERLMQIAKHRGAPDNVTLVPGRRCDASGGKGSILWIVT